MFSPFHRLIPGQAVPDDWFLGRIPANIVVGENCVVDSSFCFKHFYSKRQPGLRLGQHVSLWRTALATEAEAVIEIGDYCYLANASLVASQRITIGSHVFIAGGVTIADSDLHPLDPAARLADTIALSPIGNRKKRPHIESRPVAIEDDVWIGWNAVVLKGVRVGAGAVIEPGAIVLRDVPPGVVVAGNPAKPLETRNP